LRLPYDGDKRSEYAAASCGRAGPYSLSAHRLPQRFSQAGLIAISCACLAGQVLAQLPAGYWDLDRSQPLLDRTLEITLDPDLSVLEDAGRPDRVWRAPWCEEDPCHLRKTPGRPAARLPRAGHAAVVFLPCAARRDAAFPRSGGWRSRSAAVFERSAGSRRCQGRGNRDALAVKDVQYDWMAHRIRGRKQGSRVGAQQGQE